MRRSDNPTANVSLPFPRPTRRTGEPWRIAVKVIDPRGNEGLRVLTIQEQ